MRFISKIEFLLITLLLCLCMPIIGKATNEFSVLPILPENQRKQNVGYYDLMVSPGSEQEFYLEVFNESDQEQKFFISINPGTTNRNGMIDYSPKPKDYQYDPSLTLPITDFVSAPNHITIPAHSSDKVPIKVKMPDESFDGIIIGAIYVTSDDLEEDSKLSSKKEIQAQISNKIAYSIGIVLRETDIEPRVELNLQGFNYDNRYGQGIFQAELQNPVSMVLDDIIYDATVTKVGTDEVVAERHVTEFRFAPQSNFWLEIPVNDGIKELEPGNYMLKLSVHSEATQQSWDFESTYDVTNEESNQFKKLFEIPEEPENNKTLRIVIILVILVVIVLSSIFIYYKKFNQKEQLKKQPHKKIKQSHHQHKK